MNEATDTKRMDPEMKAKWLEALRSGKYAQGTNALRTYCDPESPDKGVTPLFCCLGVLCDISNIGRWNEDGCYSIQKDGRTIVESTVPPFPLANKLGIREGGCFVNGLTDRKNNGVSLAGLNDEGFTFAQLADIINYFM